MSINAEEWFRQEKISIETNIQVRYFVEMDDEYRNNIYRTIRGNNLDFIDVDQIVLISPFDDDAFKSMCKEMEIEPKPNSLQEMYNTQVINICHSFTRLNLEDQTILIEYAKTNKCRITISSQITKEKEQLKPITLSLLKKKNNIEPSLLKYLS
tara:strand:+ start:82 stop:543 length:462 start_codon:yes stop_codon:yes gene_type:complete